MEAEGIYCYTQREHSLLRGWGGAAVVESHTTICGRRSKGQIAKICYQGGRRQIGMFGK